MIPSRIDTWVGIPVTCPVRVDNMGKQAPPGGDLTVSATGPCPDAFTVARLRRWWRIRSDLAGTLSTPAERERATALLVDTLTR